MQRPDWLTSAKLAEATSNWQSWFPVYGGLNKHLWPNDWSTMCDKTGPGVGKSFDQRKSYGRTVELPPCEICLERVRIAKEWADAQE